MTRSALILAGLLFGTFIVLATTGSSPFAPRAEAHFNEEIGRG